jgi:hypothetical protein
MSVAKHARNFVRERVSGKSPPVLEDVNLTLTWKSRPQHRTEARLERIVFGEEQR